MWGARGHGWTSVPIRGAKGAARTMAAALAAVLAPYLLALPARSQCATLLADINQVAPVLSSDPTGAPPAFHVPPG